MESQHSPEKKPRIYSTLGSTRQTSRSKIFGLTVIGVVTSIALLWFCTPLERMYQQNSTVVIGIFLVFLTSCGLLAFSVKVRNSMLGGSAGVLIALAGAVYATWAYFLTHDAQWQTAKQSAKLWLIGLLVTAVFIGLMCSEDKSDEKK